MKKETFKKFAMFFAEHNFYHKVILKKLVELNSVYIERYKSYLLMENLERNVYI